MYIQVQLLRHDHVIDRQSRINPQSINLPDSDHNDDEHSNRRGKPREAIDRSIKNSPWGRSGRCATWAWWWRGIRRSSSSLPPPRRSPPPTWWSPTKKKLNEKLIEPRTHKPKTQITQARETTERAARAHARTFRSVEPIRINTALVGEENRSYFFSSSCFCVVDEACSRGGGGGESSCGGRRREKEQEKGRGLGGGEVRWGRRMYAARRAG